MSATTHPRRPVGRRLSRVGSWCVDHPWPVLLGTAVVLALLVVRVNSGTEHTVRAVFPNAINLFQGQKVRIDGVDAGSIESIAQGPDRQAVVKLIIEDDFWPLPQGTRAITRYGTTLGLGTRFVDLEPGPKTGPTLEQNAIIPEANTETAVELDDVFNTFEDRTRKHLRGAVGGTARATAGQQEALGRGVDGTNRALQATSGFVDDLNRDRVALSALVTQASAATRILGTRQATIEELLQAAAITFNEFGQRTAAITASLDQFAPALVETRTTLARADSSIDILDGLVTDLKPGLVELRPVIRTARPALAGLRALAPVGASTLRSLNAAAPPTTRLLRTAQPFSGDLQRLMTRLRKPVRCVRPYGPEIAGFLAQWGSWGQNYDNRSHYARVKANEGPTSPTNIPPVKTDVFLSTLGNTIKSAVIRPPGFNAGKPWYVPACGILPAGVDAAQDPEDPR